MPMAPITIFSRISNLALVVSSIRQLATLVSIEGPDDNWHKAVIRCKKEGEILNLIFIHDCSYCSEPNWSAQLDGMSKLFSTFPDTDRKNAAFMLISTFKFALGAIFEPELEDEDDPRLNILFNIAELLDGVLYTPFTLRDAHGRILFSKYGATREDPHAVWPRVI
jgi:hypothetical protein